MKNLFIGLFLAVSFGSHAAAISFKEIAAGHFLMGSPESEANRHGNENGKDGKQVDVEISKSFDIMEKEVTQLQWFEITGGTPSHFKREEDCRGEHMVENGKGFCPSLPVESVSWGQVDKFIRKLNERNGVSGCQGDPKTDSKGCLRLPTEAEWEFAARGGTTSAYSLDFLTCTETCGSLCRINT